MRTLLSSSLILAICLIVTPSFSQAPDSLSFQGRLTSPGGVAIDTPGVGMVFKLYKAGAPVWTEAHAGVAVSDGVFDVILGGSTPLGSLAFNVPMELGIKVGDDAEISPRTPLVATAYARALPGLYTYQVGSQDGTARYNVIGGSSNNAVGPNLFGATIGGGGGFSGPAQTPNNVVGHFGTIGGGISNTAGQNSTVGGGDRNVANNLWATVGGGVLNTSMGWASTIPGGSDNLAVGDYSFAAGQYGRAIHANSFVWSGTSIVADSMRTTGANQFLVRADGGVGIGVNSPGAALHVTKMRIGVSNGIFSDDVFNDDIIVEDNDAILGLYSSNGGSWGSGLVLAEMDSDDFVNGWTIVRQTSNGGAANDLYFRFGTDIDYGSTTTKMALRDNGDLAVVGAISKGSGTFKIDHPLDPQNKYLSHSFVESPDMMNVYNGNVILDGSGEAEVEMPAYFEALNRDFRYQLTSIGAPGPNLYVSKKVAANAFSIAGGEPGMEVSWQVTGVRQDPFANMHRVKPETDKPADERGTYLHPEAYGRVAMRNEE